MENYHGLDELHPCIIGWHIRVQILQLFTVPIPSGDALGLIFSDEKGNRIEGRVMNQFLPHYNKYLKQGNWVSIMTFRVWENTGEDRVTINAHKISFINSTIVKNVQPPPVETCSKFLPFSSIIDGSADTSGLIDLIGLLYDVGYPIYDKSCPRHIDGITVSFRIRGMCGKVLNCAVTGRDALDLRTKYLQWGGQPIICMLQMWRVRRWFDGPKNFVIIHEAPYSKVYPNPDVPEADDVRFMLSWIVDEVGECLPHNKNSKTIK